MDNEIERGNIIGRTKDGVAVYSIPVANEVLSLHNHKFENDTGITNINVTNLITANNHSDLPHTFKVGDKVSMRNNDIVDCDGGAFVMDSNGNIVVGYIYEFTGRDIIHFKSGEDLYIASYEDTVFYYEAERELHELSRGNT